MNAIEVLRLQETRLLLEHPKTEAGLDALQYAIWLVGLEIEKLRKAKLWDH